MKELIHQLESLSRAVGKLEFPSVHTVYNPLEYAWASHVEYISRFASPQPSVLFLGMNPGPWGMAQTGIPFGEIAAVRDWMKLPCELMLDGVEQHPKRPLLGFDCTRSEVSGRRIWELFGEKYKTPSRFFRQHFVYNYCPLVFMAESGKNITPDQLPAKEAQPLMALCDDGLRDLVCLLAPKTVVGVGKFAEARARRCLGEEQAISCILHPSPASPAANRGWAPQAEAQLIAAGIWRKRRSDRD